MFIIILPPQSFTSTILKAPVEKPWLSTHDRWSTFGQWLTRLIFLLGVCAAGAICFFDVSSIPKLGNVCLVFDDEFNSLDTNTWQREVAVGDFGNGEFQWYTANDNNSFVQNGKLYIVPTLTSDSIGENAVLNGGKIDLGNACTAVNSTGCTAIGDSSAGTVINPVQSARLTTRMSHAIQYGRVEVKAKMPKGDWLWPAIWMLPSNDTYGQWPMSGEIDIAESKGNGMDYPAQGSNFVSSALHWGPTSTIDAWTNTWGWIQQRRASYADEFHTYALEWNHEFMRFYIDSKTVSSLQVNFKKESLFDRGKFPQIITDGANQVVLKNPWQGRGNNAPFDQPFYLILNVAVGGTNGWFPDGVGNKPWVDQSATAMRDFATQQQTWSKTWPQDITQRAMIIDSVKMWRTC
ncbi:concanavalin A-like lectin/glucanase domain-containing protein [Hysterangium stoloniferum]|nr:concanavalin A-like lectin/glucanase domain-containing protein [Hysterangium stoloniferum]